MAKTGKNREPELEPGSFGADALLFHQFRDQTVELVEPVAGLDPAFNGTLNDRAEKESR